jgi:type I restriction enzyme S subunit
MIFLKIFMKINKVKLGDLCWIEKGATGIQKAIAGEYPLVVTSEERKTHNEFQFDTEAVIVPLVSSTGHGHKSLKRIHYQAGKFALGSILCAITPKNKARLNPEYLYRFLDLNREKELVGRMKGMANVTLPMKEIAQIEIPLLPIEKQLAFIEKYRTQESVNTELSTELNLQLALVKQLRQAYLQEAMQGKLLAQDPTEGNAADLLEQIKIEKAKQKNKQSIFSPIKKEETPFQIPNNWTWCRLGEICSKIGSGSTPKGSNYSKEGLPFFRSQNIYNEGLIYNDISFISGDVHSEMKSTVVYANDVLLNITGGSMGRCALVPSNFSEGNVSQHVCIIRGISVDAKFLHKLILSPFFQKLIFSSTTGAGREGLPKYNLEQFPIPLPPLAEQLRIVTKLESLMQVCDDLTEAIIAQRTYSGQLLQVSLQELMEV